MGLDDLKNKATEKLSEVTGNEETTDAGLDKASDAAKKVTGGKFDDNIDHERDVVYNILVE